jgi:hypothetical protein
MRTLIAVLTCVVLLQAKIANPERNRSPTVPVALVTVGEVRHAADVDALTAPGSLRTLVVERPVDAREGAWSSVFVLDEDGSQLRRIAVRYGRGSPSLIEIVSGASVGDRIIVSDMRAWDRFDRLRLALP